MTKTIQKQKTDFDRLRSARGITLVELLIVITILTVIAAIMIPRLRVINKDRNIREAARVVASAFAKASTRAVSDGSAGLVIVPNRNFEGGTSWAIAGGNDRVYYAGTRIFQMRKMPPYIGDDEDAVATEVAAGIQIQAPFEHDAAAGREIVKPFDHISFNGSSYRYLINSVIPAGLNLQLTIAPGSAPPPELGTTGVPFVVHRQPRRIESSMVELPDGYMIDLRYSGRVSVADPGYGTVCNQNIPPAFELLNPSGGEVEVHFNGSGGVERMFFYDGLSMSPGGFTQAQPINPLYWFVSNYEPSAFDLAGTSYLPNRDPIQSPSNKWVTLDPITGSVNVASNTVPVGGSSVLGDTISEAQTIARTRQSANQ